MSYFWVTIGTLEFTKIKPLKTDLGINDNELICTKLLPDQRLRCAINEINKKKIRIHEFIAFQSHFLLEFSKAYTVLVSSDLFIEQIKLSSRFLVTYGYSSTLKLSQFFVYSYLEDSSSIYNIEEESYDLVPFSLVGEDALVIGLDQAAKESLVRVYKLGNYEIEPPLKMRELSRSDSLILEINSGMGIERGESIVNLLELPYFRSEIEKKEQNKSLEEEIIRRTKIKGSIKRKYLFVGMLGGLAIVVLWAVVSDHMSIREKRKKYLEGLASIVENRPSVSNSIF